MLEQLKVLVFGFVIGLTGALMPGPMLFATIKTSMKNGWSTGPRVVFGHFLIEFLFVIFILYGLSSFINGSMLSMISLFGGFSLIIFGVLTIKDAKNASATTPALSKASGKLNESTLEEMSKDPESTFSLKTLSSGPEAAGFLTSVSSPYFWIWWFTAGSALVLKEYALGILMVSSYLFGHWLSDLAWYTLVSYSFSRGKELLSRRSHLLILYACGIFLIVFGSIFMYNYNKLSFI